VNVALIEPSDHRSGSNTYRPDAVKTDSSESPYSEDFKKVRSKIKNDEANGSDPLGVAKLIYGIIETKKPRLRYRVGKFDQKLSVVLRKILPGRMFEKIIYGYYH
ncbi:MAG: SDR family NAD(P)-dependent oxidoreductase, partial [Bacillota bacterium]|nr:SDR family NAD(P)-dependent oxidoreductase [Bacillota bacterium]